MTGVDEILNYKKNPDDDFYALLGCDENSTVSIIRFSILFYGELDFVIIDSSVLMTLFRRVIELTYILRWNRFLNTT